MNQNRRTILGAHIRPLPIALCGVMGFPEKFYQVLSQFGAFILPVLLFSFLVSTEPMSYLKLKQKTKTIVFSSSPVSLSSSNALPSCLSA